MRFSILGEPRGSYSGGRDFCGQKFTERTGEPLGNYSYEPVQKRLNFPLLIGQKNFLKISEPKDYFACTKLITKHSISDSFE